MYVRAVREIGVGMLGYAFMGKAHSHAYRQLAYMAWPPPLLPRLVSISGRSAARVAEAAERYGFESHTTDWRDTVADERVELFDNGGPNDQHAEPTIAAAEAGKHILCEKPLGRDADEAYEIWRRVTATGVVSMCGFNYRFVPAVRLARQMLEAGELGDIRHFRARYLQDWLADPALPVSWRLRRASAGSGALGDLGSHVVDLARYLVGEPAVVIGITSTFTPEREGGTVDVDDAFEAVVEFESGAVGTLEASRVCRGRRNGFFWEVNGSRGSIAFAMERMNELQVYREGSNRGAEGFRTVLVTDAGHPFMDHWWPPGHIVGWGATFVHEIHHLLAAIAGARAVAPHGATLADGYRAAEVCDAIARSNRSGTRERIDYRPL